jgi:peptidoglycan/LPS O-acetylase OafA/YrhL
VLDVTLALRLARNTSAAMREGSRKDAALGPLLPMHFTQDFPTPGEFAPVRSCSLSRPPGSVLQPNVSVVMRRCFTALATEESFPFYSRSMSVPLVFQRAGVKHAESGEVTPFDDHNSVRLCTNVCDSREDARVPALDGVRAVAILAVIIAHSVYHSVALPPVFANMVFDLGSIGVSVFLVLSGYLITRVMLADEAKAGKLRIRRFYKRRFLRIFPALYLYLAFVATMEWARFFVQESGRTWLSALLFFRNFVPSTKGFNTAHIWSLSLEEQFYFFWPALFVLTRKFRSSFIVLAVMVFTVWRLIFIAGGGAPGWTLSHPDLRMDTFLIGGWFALEPRQWVRHFAPSYCIVGVSLLYTFSALYPSWLTPLVAILIGAAISSFVQHPEMPEARLLARPALVWLGTVSYSLYLWQQPFLVSNSIRWWSLPAVLAAACISYYLVELPSIRLGRRNES